jgi:NAD-dependent dihydropyrimidine dehydrogenase PreA subunit
VLCPVDVFGWNEAAAKPVVAYAADCSTCFICEDACPAACIAVAEERDARHVHSIYDRLNIPVS